MQNKNLIQFFIILTSNLALSSQALAQNNRPMSIHVKSELVTEKKIVDVLKEDSILPKNNKAGDTLTLSYANSDESSVHTSTNSYETDFFSNGLSYPTIGFTSAFSTRMSYQLSAGWTDQEKMAVSQSMGSTQVRLHLIPISAGLRYAIRDQSKTWVPSIGLSATDFILVQKSDVQDAETTESYLYLSPLLGLDVRVSRGFRLMGQAGYLLNTSSSSSSDIQNLTTQIGLGIEI